MPGPPASYYKALPANIRSCYRFEDLRLLEQLGIMVDRGEGEDCAILQIFHRFVNDTPDLLIEFIERTPARDSELENVPVGCGGFGDNNVRHLLNSAHRALGYVVDGVAMV
jgi:4-hydroxyphenylpyruvate dioxygenase-like putative hemolysin